MVPVKKQRFDAGDIVCDRNAPHLPLYVVSRGARGKLTVVNAAGEQTFIGVHFVDDYIAKVCATERQLLSQRSALAALLRAASPDDCSVHARAQAALAPSPASPTKAGKHHGEILLSELGELLAPPPPRKKSRRPTNAASAKRSGATHAGRVLIDVLGIHDRQDKVSKEKVAEPKTANSKTGKR
jgi:hypothetical protein